DWGAALVSASTSGHDVTRTVRDDGGTTATVRLSLLRAPRFPDPATARGRHRLRYALAPGAAVLAAAREGYRLNLPLRTLTGCGAVEPLVTVDNDRVITEAVKLADDGSGDAVVRLYAAVGGRARARLTANFPTVSATATALLERPTGELTIPGGVIELELRPFQILTVRLSRGT